MHNSKGSMSIDADKMDEQLWLTDLTDRVLKRVSGARVRRERVARPTASGMLEDMKARKSPTIMRRSSGRCGVTCKVAAEAARRWLT